MTPGCDKKNRSSLFLRLLQKQNKNPQKIHIIIEETQNREGIR